MCFVDPLSVVVFTKLRWKRVWDGDVLLEVYYTAVRLLIIVGLAASVRCSSDDVLFGLSQIPPLFLPRVARLDG